VAWDFETDPDFQRELEWIDTFVRDEVEPLDHVLGDTADKTDQVAASLCDRCSNGSRTAGCGRVTSVPNSVDRATVS